MDRESERAPVLAAYHHAPEAVVELVVTLMSKVAGTALPCGPGSVTLPPVRWPA